ncbi:MAG: glycoside hydrolase family 9 protein [Elusimicrobiota bacterium]
MKIKFIQLMFALAAGLAVTAYGGGKFCDTKQGWGPTSELTTVPVKAFESLSGWSSGSADDRSKASLSVVPSPHGDALRVEYELPVDAPNGAWVWFVKPAAVDISKAGRISFWIRGKGMPNKFDLKFGDADGGVFMRAFHSGAKTSGWRKETIDMKELVYNYGGSNKTPEPPFKLDIAVANSYNTRHGGNGWIELAGLEQIGANSHIQILMNQIGFDPGMNKRAVIQLNNSEAEVDAPMEYSILSLPGRKVIESGKARKFKNSELWPGQYWIVSFDKLEQPGRYVLKAVLPSGDKPMEAESYPFEIKKNVIAGELSKSQFHYIKFTRYPKKPKHSNPVPGGYYDTELDIERWMSTTPTWVWAMARWQNLLSGEIPAKGFDPIDEIKYAARFCIDMQNPASGHVYFAVKSKRKDCWLEDITPEQDTDDCYLMDIYAPEVEGAYAVTMAEVYRALEKKDPELAKESLDAAVKAWEYLGRQNLDGIQYLGMYLWASTRLYGVTGDAKYLETAKAAAEKILPTQFLDYKRSQEQIFGMFFWKPDKSDFTYQYKFVHSIGVYLGLMELAEALKDDDALRTRIRFAMDYFAHGFIRQAAELNPFGKAAQALEPPEGAQTDMKLYYFASPRCPMTDHGFNCDTMSYGLIALRYARFTGNPEFARIAADQIGWVLGANPSGFCMVSGKGTTNPHVMMADIGKGPVLGGIPNGFVSPKDGNKPVWLTEWCSEEYWKPHNAMMLALMSELESDLLSDPFTAGENNEPRIILDELKAKIDKAAVNSGK